MNNETRAVINEINRLKSLASGRTGSVTFYTDNQAFLSNIKGKQIESATECTFHFSYVANSKFGRFLCLQIPGDDGLYGKDNEVYFADNDFLDYIKYYK